MTELATDTTEEENRIAEEDEGEQEYIRVRLDRLSDDPNNPRTTFPAESIQELARSIKSSGLLQPIVVREDGADEQGPLYTIIMGHRRRRALQVLGRQSTKVVLRKEEYRSADVLAKMIAENVNRESMDPIDEARGLQRLKTMRNMSDAELAKMVGKGQPWVSSRLNLLNLSPEDQKSVRNKRMTVGAGSIRGRQNAGNVRPGAEGSSNGSHLSAIHPLATKVQRRCESLKHKLGPNSVGGVGCGNCWETVLRTDERKKLQTDAHTNGECSTCGSHVEKKEIPEGD